jgi:hypothetical protein
MKSETKHFYLSLNLGKNFLNSDKIIPIIELFIHFTATKSHKSAQKCGNY